MRIEKENPKNPKSAITGPMLFARNALAPGHKLAFFPDKSIIKGKGGKASIPVDNGGKIEY